MPAETRAKEFQTGDFAVGDLVQAWLDGDQVPGIVIDLEKTINGNLSGWCKVAIFKRDGIIYLQRRWDYLKIINYLSRQIQQPQEGQRHIELDLVSPACG